MIIADLHWGGFTTQWGNQIRINWAEEKYTMSGLKNAECMQKIGQ